MGYEEKARNNHKGGYNCGMSVYSAFADILGISEEQARETAPKPRSEGGKCGAFLAGKKVLEQIKPQAVAEYERKYLELNGHAECIKLGIAPGVAGKNCNDYVGDAARLVEEVLIDDRYNR